MKPASKAQIKGTAREVVLAKNQKQYLPLAVAVSGDYVTSRWRLSFWERLRVLVHGNVFISLKNFGAPPMPLLPSVTEPEWLTDAYEFRIDLHGAASWTRIGDKDA